MEIRKAASTDEDGVINLLKQFATSESNPEWLTRESRLRRGFQTVMANPVLGEVLVMDDSGRLAGLTTLSYPTAIRFGGIYAAIEENIVDKDYRGKGVGGSLLKAAVTLAGEKGCFEIQVNGPSEMGYPVYIKRGFKDIGPHMKIVYETDGKVMREDGGGKPEPTISTEFKQRRVTEIDRRQTSL